MELIVVMRGSSVAGQVDVMKHRRLGEEAECLVISYRSILQTSSKLSTSSVVFNAGQTHDY